MARLDADRLPGCVEQLRPERDVMRGPTIVDLDAVKTSLKDELDVFFVVCFSDAISTHRWIPALHALFVKIGHHCPEQLAYKATHARHKYRKTSGGSM